MNKPFIKIVVLIILFLVQSCNSNEDHNSEYNYLITYVAAKDEGRMTTEGNFGDIYIYNYSKRYSKNVIQDKYFDENPKFYPNFQKIVFQSNRWDDERILLFQGIANPESYFYDIDTDLITKVEFDLDSLKYGLNRYGIKDYIFNDYNSNIFFVIKNYLVEYDTMSDSINNYYEITNGQKFNDIMFIDSTKIAIEYHFLNNGWQQRIGIFDIISKEFLSYNVGIFQKLCVINRSKEQIFFIQNNFIKFLSLNDGKTYAVQNMKEIVDASIHDLKLLDDNNFVLILHRGNEKYDLATFNSENIDFEWLTNDGLHKRYLDVRKIKKTKTVYD